MTTPFNIPYRLNSKRTDINFEAVANKIGTLMDDSSAVSDSVTSLANSVLPAIEDSDWVDVPVGSSYAVLSAAEKPQVRKVGSVVYMRGGIGNTGISATTSYTDIATVPVGYRPSQPLVVAIGSSTAATNAEGHIRTDGSIYLRTAASVGAYYKYDGISWLVD